MNVHRFFIQTIIVSFSMALFAGATQTAFAVSWGQRGGDTGHSSYVSMSLNPELFEDAWTVVHNDPQAFGRAVACDGRYVYQKVWGGMDYHNVCAFDLNDGSEEWRTTIQAGGMDGVGEPSVHNGIVYVNRSGHTGDPLNQPRFYGLNANTGAVSFTTAFQDQWGNTYRSTMIGNQAVVGGGHFGGMYSFSATGSGIQWHSDPPSTMGSYDPRPVVYGDYVYAFQNHVYSRTTGTELGTIDHPDDPQYLRRPIVSDTGSLIYRFDDTDDDRVVAFDASTQEHLWDFSPGIGDRSFHAIAAGGNMVGVVTSYGDTDELILLNEQSGEELFRWTNGQELGHDLILTDTHAFVQAGVWLHAIDLERGRSVWSVPATGDMALSDGYLLISGEEKLLAFQLVPEPSAGLILLAAAVCLLPGLVLRWSRLARVRRGGCNL